MTPYLQLDLNAITIDTHLARQVPYALSSYYLALPLGEENGRISVAMTYPENEKARQTLARLLRAEVVPVFVPEETLQAALERIYCPEQAQEHKHMELTVCPLPAGAALAAVLKTSQTSLFFVQGEPQPIHRILFVMRGFASDERALDWLAPFARLHGATVTLMPLMNRAGLGLNQYYHLDSPVGHHLARCLQRWHDAGVPVNLKFRQGRAVQQVVEETAGDVYDLLALAAEAEGDFVGRVITAVNQQGTHNGRSIFVLKPPALPRRPANHQIFHEVEQAIK